MVRAIQPTRRLSRDATYLEVLLAPIRVCAHYRPKLGQGGRGKPGSLDDGLSLEQFKALHVTDAFYGWLGLDNPLMYAAHKAAGGMTSVYRQIGIGSERLFRQILQDHLGLSPTDVIWSYQVQNDAGKERTLSLDARIPVLGISDIKKRNCFLAWLHEAAALARCEPEVISNLTGAVFEVRQGYKSKDSKRQNADIANCTTAYKKALFPCAMIMSNQIDGALVTRYRQAGWAILTGLPGAGYPTRSTYDFVKDIVGYDLEAFFIRNSPRLKAEINSVLTSLLKPETT